MAVEYDGLWHAEDKQFAKDRRRLNKLRAAGWTVVFVTAADLLRPEELIAQIAAALRGVSVCSSTSSADGVDQRTVAVPSGGARPRYSQPLRLKPR